MLKQNILCQKMLSIAVHQLKDIELALLLSVVALLRDFDDVVKGNFVCCNWSFFDDVLFLSKVGLRLPCTVEELGRLQFCPFTDVLKLLQLSVEFFA